MDDTIEIDKASETSSQWAQNATADLIAQAEVVEEYKDAKTYK